MFKKLIKKARDLLINQVQNQRELDNIKIQNGMIYSILLSGNLKNIKDLSEINFKVFSQNNEDGIIDYLIQSLKIRDIKFIEIGTEDYSESNTRYLFEKTFCRGLLVDNSHNLKKKISSMLKIWKGQLEICNQFINSKNILNILRQYEFDKNIDILSLDIDGIDYWILKELPQQFSKILVCEYNPYFGPDIEVTVPNMDNFNRTDYHYSNLCWGVSLKSLIKIQEEKGYTFVGTNNLKNNAFFVLKDLTHKLSINLPNTDELEMYTNANFQESLDNTGKLNFLKSNDILNYIKDCEVINLKNNGQEKVKLKEII